MKRNIILTVAVLAIAATGLYFYMYQDHRNIATEDAAYKVSVRTLQSSYSESDSLFNARYLDETIAVSGKVTALDPAGRSIVIDSVLYVQLDTAMPPLKMAEAVTVKGRLIGYDDLLGEFKMDQASLSQSAQ